MVDSVSNTSVLALYQSQTALTLLSSANGGSSDTADALLGIYSSQFDAASTDPSAGAPAVAPPTAPWASAQGTPTVSAAVQGALDGEPLIDPGSAQLDAPAGVQSQDYKNLFALYQGLNTLYDLATTAANAGTSSADPTLSYLKPDQLQTAFASGMSELENFLSNDPFQGFNLTAGSVKTEQQSSVGIPNGGYQTYTTGVIATGDESQPLAAFQGDVQFAVTVTGKYATTKVTLPDGTQKTVTTPPTTVNIDLSGMGSRPRTVDNVVNYINAQLSAAKVSTRFAVANLGTTASTITLPNGQTETTKGETQWGLTINGSSSETVSFSAPSTAAAVYVSSATGGAKTYAAPGSDPTDPTDPTADPSAGVTQTTTPTGEQLMKLQTGNDVVGQAPPTIAGAGVGGATLPSGGVFAKALPDGVSDVEASATAADGSVYLLADATGSVNSAPIQGGQGVVLLKYDAAGKLLSSKVVAGLQNASGASIAVAADGSVAVAATNTTTAATQADGLTTPASTAAFVQVYDPTGAPLWNAKVPAMAGTSTATGVAFGADGSVYLSGQTTGSVGGQAIQGDTDEFIQGFDKTGKASFTRQFGSHGTNSSAGLVYDASTNSLYTAGLEDSEVVVRSFSLSGTGATAKAAPSGSRNLGMADSLAGIGLAGGQLVVGGTAGAATIKAGAVTQAYAGVSDGFIASIDLGLAPSASDTVAYTGKPGVTQKATTLAVAGGQAYLAGTVANDPSSLAAPGATEGFVTGVDVSTGAVSYATRFAGANGQAAPSAITVATAGSSVLDRLGLPTGTINAATSNLVVASTSIQAGQSFWVRTSPGGPQTQVTVTAKDTLATLTDKLNLALGGAGTAQVLPLGANSQLEITPNDPSAFIELDAQQASDLNPGASASSLQANVLAALGLSPGVIRTVREVNKLTDVTQLREYGLNLPTNLDLSATASAQHAANALQAAMSAVQQAYQDLADPPTMASEAAAAAQASGGTVPTYLTNEIANYQAGLNRLTGGSSS